MNRRVVVIVPFAMALTLSACNVREASVGEAKEAAVRQEVAAVMKAFFAASERVDVEAMRQVWADSPDFLYVDEGGKQYDTASFRQFSGETLAGLAAERDLTRKEQIYVLGPMAAVYVWQGSIEVTPKAGPVLRLDPYNAVFLLKKADARWRIHYQQGSTPAPHEVQPPVQK